MPKAIFHRDAEIRSKTRNVAWSIKASPDPQSFPRECIELAVASGAAEIVAPTRKKESVETPDKTDG
ncbi:hypothetical protein KPG71_18740 [Roseovarius sp. PS-C2]|uniref:hypothetical protein n=1 Tax=Roseovarius sp. PS-C2 TaxID=2820814 RepID=UPI001C0E8BB9|nr:hypothetical protein [Roseovarius sp. PS-C2]MBU3262063.1 hypothetical protein [Roseovarius sp. PS-C2]